MADRYDTAKKMSGLSRGELGDILRELRRAAGFTQEELAARAGVSNRAISDIERAIIRRPRRETLRLLADALGLSAADRAALEDARQHASHRPAVPPVALSHALPDGLPTMQGPLIGRERERAAARVILQTEPARLLTVTGMGGVGKTRLALSVATDMQNTFADGAVFVSLAMVREGAFFFTAIANALGVRESPGEQVRDALLAYLRSRHLLLVLDNFEHLIEEAIEVANLLAHCPRLVALVTSREPLRIRGEHLLSLLPLTLPEDGADYAAIVASPAVSLFCQAAAAAAYTFALTPANGATVAAICAQLDGLPLALELAAAQLRLLSLDALFGRLATRLPELVGGPRDAPARQRTMRLAIAWSYDLLTVDEAAVFRRIAVFVGGCTREAAVAVCDAVGDAATVSHALASLMDKS
ncbi:MAG: ATP-binding protein, partial [Thermomicrobiales bacterium]